MPGLAGKVEYAQFLHDGSEIRFTEGQVDHFSLGASRQADLLVVGAAHGKAGQAWCR